ncbi:MAG: hypothetical protein WC511_07055 [Candidatus Pacearchaeota archaeon]|jgi:hypothetical protein
MTYEDLGYTSLLNKTTSTDLSNGINSSNVESFVDSGSIGYAQTSLFKLKPGEDIESGNFVAGSNGWKLWGDGNFQAVGITLTGGIFKYGKTSFTDSAHAGYYFGSEGMYLGSVSDSSMLKYNISSGNFDYIGTISNSLFTLDIEGNCKVSSLARDDFHWFTIFESVDGFSKVIDNDGTILATSAGVVITTGTATNNDCKFNKSIGSQMNWGQNRKFKCELSFSSNSNQEIYVVTGTASSDNPNSKHFGFVLMGANLYATVANGTNQYTTELITISPGSTYLLEAVLNHVTGIIKYYIDGDLVLTGDGDGTPTGATAQNAIYIGARTQTNSAKAVTINWFDFWQAI